MNQQAKAVTPFPNAERNAYLALVTKVNGDGRYDVDAIVPRNKNIQIESYLAVLPGRMRRIARRVKAQNWVLIQPWEFTTVADKADLIHLYDDAEVQHLKYAGYMKFGDEDRDATTADATTATTAGITEEDGDKFDLDGI